VVNWQAWDRILEVSRTTADSDGAANIEAKRLSQAIHYRALDRCYCSWGRLLAFAGRRIRSAVS
jgi:hypothetical protein